MHKFTLTVIEAVHLEAKDKEGPDPYCEIKLGKQKVKTAIVKKSLKPRWNETFYFDVNDKELAGSMVLIVNSHTKGLQKREFMGMVEVPLSKVVEESSIQGLFELQKKKDGDKVSGKVRFKLVYGNDNSGTTTTTSTTSPSASGRKGQRSSMVVKSPEKDSDPDSKRHTIATSIDTSDGAVDFSTLSVEVIQGKDLEPKNPRISLTVGEKKVRTKPGTSPNHKWQQKFTFPAGDALEMTAELTSGSKKAGMCKIPLGDVTQKPTVGWHEFKSGTHPLGLIQLKLQFIPRTPSTSDLKKKEAKSKKTDGSEYDPSADGIFAKATEMPSGKPVGVIALTMIDGKGLLPKDVITSDPYCEVQFEGERRLTQVITNTLTPTWDEGFILRVHSKDSHVAVHVWDEDPGKKPGFLGRFLIPLAEITSQEEGMLDKHYVLQQRTKRSHVAGTVHVSVVWKALTDGKDIETLYKDMETQFKAAKSMAKTKNKGAFGDLLSFGQGGKGKIIGKVHAQAVEAKLSPGASGRDILATFSCEDGTFTTQPSQGPNPKWVDGGSTFQVASKSSVLKVKIMGMAGNKSTVIGKVALPLNTLSAQETTTWYDLKEGKTDITGKVLLKCSYEDTEGGEQTTGDSNVHYAEDDPKAEYLLKFKILTARNLPPKDGDSQDGRNMYCVCWFNGKKFNTSVAKSTMTPEWEDEFIFPVYDPAITKVRIMAEDSGEEEGDMMADLLGEVILDLATLRESVPQTQWYALTRKSGGTGGELQIRTKISRKDDDSNDDDEYDPMVTPSGPVLGTITIHVIDARNLVKKDLLSKNDPYVQIQLEGQEWKSSVKKDNDKPTWNETCKLNLRNKKSKIEVQVWDFNSSTPDAFLGHVTIDLTRVTAIKQGSQDEDFQLEKRSKKSRVSGTVHLKLEWKEGDVAPTGNDYDAPAAKPAFQLPEPELSPLFSPETAVTADVEHDVLYKVIVIGDSAVGKTNIFGRWLFGKFFEDTTSTINIEFAAKAFRVEDKVIKVQIWDTAGQERFRAITRQYYRGAHGVAFVYDITSSESYEHIAKWLAELKEFSDNPDISMLMIGNKTDLERQRQVPTQDALAFAKQEKLALIETSAKSGENCIKAMQLLLQEIHTVEQAKQQKLLAGGEVGGHLPGASVVIGDPQAPITFELCQGQC